MPETELICSSTTRDSNLAWATRMHFPDPVIYLGSSGRKTLIVNDLELGRARREAKVDEVLSQSALEAAAREAGIPRPTFADVIARTLAERKTPNVVVPADFPVHLADELRGRGLGVAWRREPFFPARVTKTDVELGHIREAVRATEAAYQRAWDCMQEARIVGRELHWRGSVLTAERLRHVIDAGLFELGFLSTDTIVACGDQATDPHARGEGPLRPNETIIVDIFPKSLATGYVADMTRTWVKGRAPDEVRRMHETVLRAHAAACAAIRPEVDSGAPHAAAKETFETAGFRTETIAGRPTGFFHGTGHGIGLDVHEAPRVGRGGSPLAAGMVLAIEPALYYPGIGGVRVEDDVVVTANGHENLCVFPKALEIP